MIPAVHQQTVDVPASLGWRFLAQLVDLTIAVFVFGLIVSIYLAFGVDVDREMEDGWLIEITFGAVVFCYFLLFEGLLSATPGKMAAGLRVTMRDGSRLTGGAAIVRNLVRLPELMFWYIPSIISVAASPERRRIGDFVASTIVWRRLRAQPAPSFGPPVQAPPGPSLGSPVQPRGPSAPSAQSPDAQLAPFAPPPDAQTRGTPPAGAPLGASPSGAQAPPPGPLVDWVSFAGDACLTAARNLANAENAYRLMAEREHLRLVQFGLTEAGSDALSAEYVATWDALAEAVVDLQQSYHRLAEVLGADVGAFIAAQPRLLAAVRAVDAYLPAASDDDVVAIFRRRLEAAQDASI